MDLQQLRYLVAVADEANFSRAAERLGVAQPSLSQQIKKLEGAVGRPLLDRLPKRVVPTQAGERLLAHARRILAEVSDAERQLAEGAGQVAGTVAVGAIPTIAPFVLPRVLRRMNERYPDVEVRIVEDVTARLVDAVERGELDVAVISGPEGARALHVEKLAEEPLQLLVPAGHRLARRPAVTWAALARERFLVLHEMHCLSGQVSRVCERMRLRPPVVMRGAHLFTIGAMVSAGLGVSVVPTMMALEDRTGRCAYVPFARNPPRREITAAWSLLRYRTNAARAFVALLGKELGRTEGGRNRSSPLGS
jgi:LysR family hydrogen peroxide-inducible transcriptional activator